MGEPRWDRRLTLADQSVPVRVRASVDEALSVADVWTPADALMALEDGGTQTDGQRRMVVRVHQFVLFGEFVSVGVDELAVLKIRSLIMLRVCAPRLLQERFGLSQAQAMKLEKKLWNGLTFFYRQRDYVPLSVALTSFVDEVETWHAEELGLSVTELRMLRFGEFCTQIASTCRNIDAFAKTVASVLRRVKTEFVAALGASQADFGRKFGERRATVQAREKRSIEKPVKDSGQRGFKLLGGTKSEGHRQACQRAQMGNTNRSDGEKRRKAAGQ